MLIVKICILLTLICVAASHEEHPTFMKTCDVGDITENDCNKCVCSIHHIFECNPKPCNGNGIPNTTKTSTCHPNTLYVRNSTVCLCKETGVWPHSSCETIFRSFNKKLMQCKPNSYVIVNCNVCRCGPDGKLDKNHCTKNECEKKDKIETRRFTHHNQVYGSCEARNWYSLAPCQFCYCVSENKLVCNTGNNYSKNLQLGSYNLSICGKDLVKDAVSLIPHGDINLLRFGNKVESVSELLEVTTANKQTEENSASIDLNREINEEQINKKLNESEEYYSDTEEVKAPMTFGIVGSSTQLPYNDEENNVSEDMRQPSEESSSDMKISVSKNFALSPPLENRPREKIYIDKLPRESAGEPLTQNRLENEKQPFLEHLQRHKPESSISMSGVEQQAPKLGDVLKPYLPMVLNKVFKMALRKSMVSLEPNSNCNPGSTTTFKCNTCFCMKNNKLLCTKQKCNKINST